MMVKLSQLGWFSVYEAFEKRNKRRANNEKKNNNKPGERFVCNFVNFSLNKKVHFRIPEQLNDDARKIIQIVRTVVANRLNFAHFLLFSLFVLCRCISCNYTLIWASTIKHCYKSMWILNDIEEMRVQQKRNTAKNMKQR